MLGGELRRLVEVDQFVEAVDIEQAVEGVVLAQFFQRHPVALDAVAGAVQQRQVVEFIVARRSLRRPAGADVVDFQQRGVQAAVGPARFVAAAPAARPELVDEQLLGGLFGDAARPTGGLRGRGVAAAGRAQQMIGRRVHIGAAREFLGADGVAFRPLLRLLKAPVFPHRGQRLFGGIGHSVQGDAVEVEPAFEHRPGAVGHIAGNPPPPQVFSGDGGGGAAGEHIQHHLAGVAAGADDALIEGQRFLRGVAGFLPPGGHGYVVDEVRTGDAPAGRQIGFDFRQIGFGMYQQSVFVQRLQFGRNGGVPVRPAGDEVLRKDVLVHYAFAGGGPMPVMRGGVVALPDAAGFASADAGGVQRQSAVGPPPILVVIAVVRPDIIGVVRLVLSAPDESVALRVIQQAVGYPAPLVGIRLAAAAVPGQFVAVVFHPEHGVQQQPQIAVGAVVAVQIEAAGRFQDAMTLDQARRHIDDVGGFVFGGAKLHGLDGGVNRGVVVLDLHLPGRMNVGVPVPVVFDAGFADALVVGGAVGLGQGDFFGEFGWADGRAGGAGKGFVGGKGRVDGNQVDALVVDAAEERQIVHYRQGAVRHIQLTHRPIILIG